MPIAFRRTLMRCREVVLGLLFVERHSVGRVVGLLVVDLGVKSRVVWKTKGVVCGCEGMTVCFVTGKNV